MGDDSPALQLELPGEVGEIHALTAPEDSPQFSGCTGEHRAHIRRLRESILELTAAGVGVKRTAAALQISPATVRAVRASAWERGELDPMKQKLGRQYLATADLLRAEALDRIDEIPANVLLLASAQAADKGQLLTGGVTARVERIQVPADLAELVDALPVECTPVESGPGALNKGGEVLGLQAPADVLGTLGAEPVSDSVSAALQRQDASCVSACVSPSSPDAPAAPTAAEP